MKIHEILDAEKIYADKLQRIVDETLEQKELITTNLIEIESDRGITRGQRLADKLARFGGSWTFTISFIFVIIVWILLNTYFALFKPFDPYPFILLNLLLSCLAALQAPVIMMSQNRQEEKDRRRERSDLIVNLKAEMEIRILQEKMDLLLSEQMINLFEIQREQLAILKRMESRDQKTHHPNH